MTMHDAKGLEFEHVYVLGLMSARMPGPQDLPAALEELSLDIDNKALVITGTGDSFMDQIDGPSLGEIFKPAVWEKTRAASESAVSFPLGDSVIAAGEIADVSNITNTIGSRGSSKSKPPKANTLRK